METLILHLFHHPWVHDIEDSDMGTYLCKCVWWYMSSSHLISKALRLSSIIRSMNKHNLTERSKVMTCNLSRTRF